MTQRDKFQTANRLAAIAEMNKPRNEREEMRPLSPAEVREREFVEVKGKREFQRYVVDRYVFLALARILWPTEYGAASTFDGHILLVMEDDDFRAFVYGDENVARLILFRDNLRRKMS